MRSLSHRLRLAGLFALFAAGSRAPARADLLYFERGGAVQAPATVSGELVRVSSAARTYEFRKSDFKRIVPGFDEQAEARQAVQEALAGQKPIDARFEAAWRAIAAGLPDDAEPVLRAIVRESPNHQPEARMVAVLDRLKLALPDPEFASIEQALGGGSWKVSRSGRLAVFHQQSGPLDARLETLERMLKTFYLTCAAWGFDARLPERRLVSVFFSTRDDYRAFLGKEIGKAFAATQGFYHPTRRLVVTFDTRDLPEFRAREAEIERERGEVKALEETIAKMPAKARARVALKGEPPRTLDRARAKLKAQELSRDIARQELMLDLDEQTYELVNAVHEQFHQLARLSGLARGVGFPIWLHEGLAMQFEVVRGGVWAGADKINDFRLPNYRKLENRASAAQIVADQLLGRGFDPDLYAQAWAFTYFLRLKRPREFQAYLDLLRDEGSRAEDDLSPADRNLRLFKSIFGSDINSIDQEYKLMMKTLTTPLEEGDRSPRPGGHRAESERKGREGG